ncbi:MULTISPECIES: dsRBD fold-containing protein [unclassified Cellulomonas]|uniref:dsRBD fold-containing protein n=1 Tax=unclassified Cellulomonas TaxID=2620175 RepID=UPI0019B5CA81|nr:dsRBD fold-containing protein [Cellulomonas sp. ES6]MBD3779419.1 DUF1876 family protein [Micrococcales bacterium]WHP18180.1 DUF1876 family protein [Cellulomonas sp. ES6]
MTHTWDVRIDLFEASDVPAADHTTTTAHAILSTSAGTRMSGTGRARRRPGETDVPEIGDELAAARALRELADRLLAASSADISEIEHREVRLAR